MWQFVCASQFSLSVPSGPLTDTASMAQTNLMQLFHAASSAKPQTKKGTPLQPLSYVPSYLGQGLPCEAAPLHQPTPAPPKAKNTPRGTDAQPDVRRVGGGRARTSPPPTAEQKQAHSMLQRSCQTGCQSSRPNSQRPEVSGFCAGVRHNAAAPLGAVWGVIPPPLCGLLWCSCPVQHGRLPAPRPHAKEPATAQRFSGGFGSGSLHLDLPSEISHPPRHPPFSQILCNLAVIFSKSFAIWR